VSALALQLPIADVLEDRRGADSASAGPGGEPTLDSLLSGMWEGLAAHRSVTCPLCGGEVRPDYGAHAVQPDDPGAGRTGEAGRRTERMPKGGSCQSCETRLS
jgi:hypothetical protein